MSTPKHVPSQLLPKLAGNQEAQFNCLISSNSSNITNDTDSRTPTSIDSHEKKVTLEISDENPTGTDQFGSLSLNLFQYFCDFLDDNDKSEFGKVNKTLYTAIKKIGIRKEKGNVNVV